MMQFIIFIIIGAFALWLGWLLAVRQMRRRSGSLYKAREAVQKRKEAAKQQVLSLFEQKDRIMNDDVEQLLDVSHKTATNYLDELEQDGKIIQRGKIGRGVFYTKK